MSIFKLCFKNFNPNFSFFVDKSMEESESKLNLKIIILEKGGGVGGCSAEGGNKGRG